LLQAPQSGHSGLAEEVMPASARNRRRQTRMSGVRPVAGSPSQSRGPDSVSSRCGWTCRACSGTVPLRHRGATRARSRRIRLDELLRTMWTDCSLL
jgi:hypothetical protein